MAKRAGLGRGLGALLGETVGEVATAQDGEGTPRELSLDEIVPNPNQPRRSFDDEELGELAESVRLNGILQPLVVRAHEGTYQIVAGERRYQAARRAGLTHVPVVVREVADDEILKLALIENLQRSDLNPLEAAEGYRTLIEQNDLTQEELATALSKSRSAIANALRLLDLPEDVRELVRSGLLTAGHARAILSVKGDEGRSALAHKVKDEGLSVRQTEILGPLFSGKDDRVPPKRTPAPDAYKQAARRLRNRLAAKVSVRTVRGKNKIEIEFDGDEELEAIVNKILATKPDEGGYDALI